MSKKLILIKHCHMTFVITHWTILVLVCISMIGHCERKGAPRWWNVVQLLPQTPRNRSAETEPFILCSKIPSLVPKQLRFCRSHSDMMHNIAAGTRYGIRECQFQFKGRRWNCSTINLKSPKSFKRKSIFGNVLNTASRETAFVHAITTAGIAYSVTKACSTGQMGTCGCDPETRELPSSLGKSFQNRNWRWGGCNDNVDYGIRISQEFVDDHIRGTKARLQMNKHNNQAGREVLKNNMLVKCKCHGLSGSCELETCWWSMPSFRRVGSILKEKYDAASEMTTKKHKGVSGRVRVLIPRDTSFQQPKSEDLIYYEKSLDFCEPNKKRGILGTEGRRCNATSNGIEGCNLLCCRRGSTSEKITKTERCRCVFQWCCHVKCKECTHEYIEHTCK